VEDEARRLLVSLAKKTELMQIRSANDVDSTDYSAERSSVNHDGDFLISQLSNSNKTFD
jgi:hypothetical protein